MDAKMGAQVKALKAAGFEVLYFWGGQWKITLGDVDGRGESLEAAFQDWKRRLVFLTAALQAMDAGQSTREAMDAARQAADAFDALNAGDNKEDADAD